MAVDTQLRRHSATSLIMPFMTPGAFGDTAGVVLSERVAVTWCYSGVAPEVIACPTDCTNCCYEQLVWIYYLTGTCKGGDCTDYNGMYTLLQQGVDGTDCEWLYTDPVDGWTIRIHCDAGYWWLTIDNDGTTCAQWKYSLAGYP